MQFHLIQVPNPILKEVCDSVKKIDWKTKELIRALKTHIWKYNALGISAPQLGICQRIIICRYKDSNLEDSIRTMINPVIIEHSNETDISVEGCLSIPGIEVSVERYHSVKISYLNEKYENKIVEAKEVEGFIMQHEIDHLEGILMIEKRIHNS